jgi:Phosphotransferase enzyme family
MPERAATPPWSDAGWRAEADAWTDAQLGRLGLARTGPGDARVRPWSIVVRVPTDGGNVFFKTTAPAMANDAHLTALLADGSPDAVLAPLAADPDRGWMLIPDGGERLRDVLDRDGDLEHWHRILPLYARLQIAEAGHAGALLAAGAFDRRSESLPAQYAALLEDRLALAIGEPDGLTAPELARLGLLREPLESACRELARGPIPPSIQHDDFHDGNILVQADGYRFIDWGDAAVAHPFGTLLVTLRSIAQRFDIEGDAPGITDLRDRYLRAWADGSRHRASPAELRRIARLAEWVAMVGRALTWRAALELATPEEWSEDHGAVAAWLRDFAADVPD